MIKVAMCGDDEGCLRQVEKILNDYACKNKLSFSIHSFTNAVPLLETMNMDFQIYIFDVDMASMKKMRLVHSIKKMDKYAYLIFLTSAIELTKAAYFVPIINYLTKPLHQTAFDSEVDRAIRHIEKIANNYMFIKNHDGLFKVYLPGVYYIETFNRNLLIHTDHGNYLCFKKMQQLENELINYPFIRCHSSYIVNMDYIRKITNNEIELENHDKILVSKWRRKNVVESLASYVENV
ncbi:LytR/AlgR family response regulator transcription factor [Paenibacillus sp. TH7-28]